MLAVLAGIIYVLPAVAAVVFISEELILLRAALFYPLVELSVCAVHELSHAFLFKRGGAELKQIRVGVFNFDFASRQLTIFIQGLFSGNCTVKIENNTNRNSIIAAIVFGGVSGILIAAIFLLINMQAGVDPSVLLCYVITGFAEGAHSLLYPKSADRKLLEEWIRK